MPLPREKVRICHVVNRLDIGGMENGVVNLLNRHDRTFFQPMLCCLNGTGAMLSRIRPDVCVFNLELAEGRKQLLYGPFKAVGLFRRERPSVVHTHGWGGGSFIGIVGARLAGVPVTVNGEHGSFSTRARQVVVQRIISLLCDATLSVSQSLKDQIVQNLGIRPSRITVIPNGVDTDVFGSDNRDNADEPERQGTTVDGIDRDSFVIGCVGTLRPEKNQKALVQAIKRIAEHGSVPRLKALFIGDGPDRSMLTQLVSQWGLDGHVSFLGHRNDVPALLSRIDVLVSTSLPYWEGLSNVMLEAMSSGIPVISTKSVGSSEVVADGVNGFVVDPNDTEALCSKIEFLARDSSRLKEMGRNAREFVRSNYSIEKMVASYEELYMKLLEKRGGN